MVGHLLLDAQFQEAARNSDRLRNMALPPFVALADVEQYRARLFEHPACLVDIDRLNLRARLVQNIL